jgi:hypothetical protein
MPEEAPRGCAVLNSAPERAGVKWSSIRRQAVIHAFDPSCLAAFERLLATPDPPEMPRRVHVQPYGGDPERRVTRLPVILMGWLQRRHLELDREESMAMDEGAVEWVER